ncbi:MAG: phosphomethylpyrimidine synthase ThiC [Victivallales bacterium]|nr:phosphomethylpyrimidine synthase ThiC [Victivallales bacterium]
MRENTQLEKAVKGDISPEMREVAAKEHLDPEFIRSEVAAGRIVIPANHTHTNLAPIGIGKSLTTKINANIGNSAMSSCPKKELAKLDVALRCGADTVMDLSTGENICEIRRSIVAASPAPVGTVPIYEALSLVEDPMLIDIELLLKVVEQQAKQGVDYMTIHAGLLREHVPLAMKRLMRIVSRGGAVTAKWMQHHQKENPFHENFDRLLEICQRHDVTLSLGDGLRPGCLADSSDDAQFAELQVIARLVRKCRDAGVQVMVEGPGHVPLDQIEMNMRKEDKLCDGAPFYILGPVVADCAPGYDHITSAIGAAMGAFHGASMLCYVTPREHLGLPDIEDVRQGVIAFKIAAHAADVALKRPHARDRDDAISRARMAFDWEAQFNFSLDPERAREIRAQSLQETQQQPLNDDKKSDHCTMCGPKYCSLKTSLEITE